MGYKKQAGIYLIFNLLSRKSYIGYSETIRKRWQLHRNRLRRNKHKNSHLQDAWNMYGEKAFIFSILEDLPLGLSKEEYEKVETKWVLFYNSHKAEFGYNAVLPGTIPLKYKDENTTKKRIRVSIPIIVLNKETGEEQKASSIKDVVSLYRIRENTLRRYLDYWSGKEHKKKSWKGLIFVRESEYKPDFNYIDYKKERIKGLKYKIRENN